MSLKSLFQYKSLITKYYYQDLLSIKKQEEIFVYDVFFW